MNNSIGDEVKALYGKELAEKPPKITGRKSKLLTYIVIGVPGVAVIIAWLVIVHYFAKFVTMQQHIYAQGSRIEIEYQRRADLIPKLIGIAKEYAQHERDLFKYVSDARDLQKMAEKMESELGTIKAAEIEKSIAKLMALAEQYPDLKATQSFQDLMEKVQTAEDRIASMRETYAAFIRKYNTTMDSFPDAVFALLLRFKKIEPYHPEKDPMPIRNNRIFWM